MGMCGCGRLCNLSKVFTQIVKCPIVRVNVCVIERHVAHKRRTSLHQAAHNTCPSSHCPGWPRAGWRGWAVLGYQVLWLLK